jgi:hypothetical protein
MPGTHKRISVQNIVGLYRGQGIRMIADDSGVSKGMQVKIRN